MDNQFFKVNDKASYAIESEAYVSDNQHRAIRSVIGFLQTFDDRSIHLTCQFDEIMGGISILCMTLGKIGIYGFSGEDDEVLIMSYINQLAECVDAPKCRVDKQNKVKSLLTTA